MKFEFERVDSRFIQRRVAEEERKNGGKRVTKVKLTSAEWAEFLTTCEWLRYQTNIGSLPQIIRISRLMSISYASNDMPLDAVPHIEVTLE